MSQPLPTLFLSHGSPMHAIQPGAVRAVWEGIARDLPRPKVILIASAHWETDLPALSGVARPETIHDFYGFPKPLYEIQYPAPGSPELASRAVGLLKQYGLNATSDPLRGLDHGAWSPLLYMYPKADVPVVQVAVQTPLGPKHHVDLGRALAPLADEGIFIVGSGHMTHNLRERSSGAPAAYARQFQAWVKEKIEARDFDALVNYRALNPHGVRAHPTDEHFLPLFVALGAARDGYKAERLYDGIEMGSLAMDAYLFS
ncbi:MAG: dioxygenase [Betaproteobacteria bacterium]|nr:dioxygenase [Betaproteobacteria bacterium]